MDRKWLYLLTVFLMLALALSFVMACGDDDDDDDDDDSAPPSDDDDDNDDTTPPPDDDDDDNDTISPEELFCTKAEECEVDAYVVPGACEASAAVMSDATLACAELEECDDFIDCVEDTDDEWALDTIDLKAAVFEISAPDFVHYEEYMKTGVPRISPNEIARVNYQYDDRDDCDLRGGKIWASVDNGEFEEIRNIPQNAQCRMLGSGTYLYGFSLEGDYAIEGTHEINTVFTDENGRQSEILSTTYKIEDYAYSIGSVMSDFTLQGVNPPAKALSDISLSDFTGDVVLINVSQLGCPACRDEANHLEDFFQSYMGENFMVMTLLLDPGLTEQDLLDWVDRPDPYPDLTFPVLHDSNGGVTGPWFVSNFVPFNMILDADHACRFKFSGYSEYSLTEVIDELLGIIK